MFKQLHEAGARLDTGLAKGILPIHLAALNDNVGIVGYCLNKDPALLYKSDDNGLNNAHYACSSYYKSISPDLKVVKFLILKYRQEAMTAFSQKSQLSGKTALGMGFYTDNTVNNIKNVVLVILLLDRVKYSLSATNLLDLVIGNYASASIDSHIAVMAPSGQQSAESIFLAIAKIRNNANLSESEQALELMKLCYIPREYPHGLDEEEVSKNIGDYAAKGEFEIVWRWLQSDKFQANWQNKQGDTLVTHMLSHGGQNKNYLRLIQLLIDSGCQIDPDLTKGARKKSKSCKTAMQIAASNGDREVVNILINSGKEFKTENVDLVPKDKEVKFKDLIEQIDEHVQKMQAELLATEANSNSNAVSKDKKLKKKKGGKLGNATKLGNGFLDPEGKDLLIQEAQEQHLDAEATILREQSPVRMRSMVVSRHVGICSLKNHLATDREIVEYNNLVKNIDLDPVVRERGGFGEPELFLKLLESDDDSEIDSYFANVKKVRALQNTEQTYGR
ncbi:MAG: ankyrin repeat domain-containing protein [Rickettsiales bacterium]|nr:ankyrin repeat domain-containing protein [Rickettsiales bacterium]